MFFLRSNTYMKILCRLDSLYSLNLKRTMTVAKAKFSKELSARIQFVTGGLIDGVSPSFVLETNIMKEQVYHRTSYIFNCGEEAFLMSHHRGRMLASQYILITRNSLKNIGGIPSLQKTEVAPTIRYITSHDHPTMINRNIVQGQNIRNVRSASDCTHYQNEDLRIDFLPLFANTTRDEASDEAFRHCSVAFLVTYADKPVKDPTPALSKYLMHLEEKLTTLDDQLLDSSLSKGKKVKTKKQRDALAEKQERLKTKLEGYKQIFSDTDTKYTSLPSMLVLEIPDHTYLDSLLSSPDLQEHCPDVRVVIHMSKQKILDDERYNVFLNRFCKDTYHIGLNETCRTFFTQKLYQNQLFRTYLDDRIFPPLCAMPTTEEDREFAPGELFKATPTKSLYMKPDKVLWCDEQRKAAYEMDYSDKELANELSVKLKKALNDMRNSTCHKAEEYPVVHFLGTGGCLPDPYRGQSSIYMQTGEDSALLLDCGEGTLNRLIMAYGDQVDEMLAKLKSIFISHLHRDHVQGLVSVLKARMKALRRMGRRGDPVIVLAPARLRHILGCYHKLWPRLRESVIHIEPKVYLRNDWNIMSRLCSILNLKKVDQVEVCHGFESYGFVIEHRNDFKIVYSGDTAPSENLVHYGNNCDLLIHEASFLDGMEKEAAEKYHSTIGDAVESGRKMGARHVILTHLSTYHTTIPYITDEMLQWTNIGFAFDNMRVTKEDLPYLHLMIPILKTISKHQKNENGLSNYSDFSKSNFRNIL